MMWRLVAQANIHSRVTGRRWTRPVALSLAGSGAGSILVVLGDVKHDWRRDAAVAVMAMGVPFCLVLHGPHMSSVEH